MVVSGNGIELTSNAILRWQEKRKVERRHFAQGKPMQNGFVQSFNGGMRDDLLTEHLVRQPAPCPHSDGGRARRLQPSQPAFKPRWPDIVRIC